MSLGYSLPISLVYILFAPSLTGTQLNNFFVVPFFFLALLLSIRKYPVVKFKGVKGLIYLFGVWIFLSPISYFFSDYEVQSLLGYAEQCFRVLLLIVTVFYSALYAEHLSRERVEKISIVFALCSISFLVLGEVNSSFKVYLFDLYYNQSDINTYFAYMDSRPGLTIGNPNSLAFICNLMFPFIIYSSRMSGAYKTLITCVFIMLIIVTRSRTGAVCLVLTLMLFPILDHNLKRFSFFFLTVLASLFVLFKLNIIDIYIMLDRYYFNVNLAGREDLWVGAIESLIHNGNLLLGGFVPPAGINYIDNEYINIVVRYGLIGLLLFIIVFIRIFLKSITMVLGHDFKNEGKILVILVLVFLISSITSAPLTSLKSSLVFLVFMSALLSNTQYKVLMK